MTLLGVVTSPDPTRPSPPTLHEHHVVAHAVRHLANLQRTDPTIRRAVAAADSPSWRHLLAAAGTVRTGSHDDIHNRAAAATLQSC